MSEIAKCVCGNEVAVQKQWMGNDAYIYWVTCGVSRSCWTGPTRWNRKEAVEAWNRLMKSHHGLETYWEGVRRGAGDVQKIKEQAFREGQERTQRECRYIVAGAPSLEEAVKALSAPLVKMEVER